jgi:hypothetical protein
LSTKKTKYQKKSVTKDGTTIGFRQLGRGVPTVGDLGEGLGHTAPAHLRAAFR